MILITTAKLLRILIEQISRVLLQVLQLATLGSLAMQLTLDLTMMAHVTTDWRLTLCARSHLVILNLQGYRLLRHGAIDV